MVDLDHLSYSSKHQYDTCPEQWRLQRVEKLPDVPGVYHAGGTAIHLMIETWNKAQFGIYEEWHDWTFPEYFDQAVDALEARTGADRATWKVAGDKKNPEDLVWWSQQGVAMFNRWKNWYNNSPYTIWVTPDGEPAIELEMSAIIGGVKVTGFIDTVLEHVSGVRGVVDYKSGKPPRTKEQLAGYGRALSDRFPLEPITHGAYFMVKGGVLTGWHDLTAEMEMLDYEYQQVAEAVDKEIFPARPSGLCRKWCAFNKYCYSFSPGSPEALSVSPTRSKEKKND